jgi:hypothetical protein
MKRGHRVARRATCAGELGDDDETAHLKFEHLPSVATTTTAGVSLLIDAP